MLWVPLHLAAAYACTYPFDRRDPDTIEATDTVGSETAFLTAIDDSAPDNIGISEFKARRTQCEYAAANGLLPALHVPLPRRVSRNSLLALKPSATFAAPTKYGTTTPKQWRTRSVHRRRPRRRRLRH